MKLPDFPWDLLAPYKKSASAHPGGLVDLSIGTPVDDSPTSMQEALAASGNAPGYPLTIGSPELRTALERWIRDRFLASHPNTEFDFLPTIGSKELVGLLPTFMQAKKVLIPEIAYPTYLVGAMLAQSHEIAVDIDASQWPQADLAWVNSPANPTGRVHSEAELRAVIQWSRKNKAVVISDECYLEFGDGVTPTSIFAYSDGDNANLLAVHSLSKRSSLAGYRAAFMVGDPVLIAAIREIRKQAGMMVALPVQKAMTAALGDDEHVATTRKRYNSRRATLKPALEAAGFRIEESVAGLYIWCTRNEDAWKSVDWLAEIGILATPGTFYGPDGSHHIRVAMTATDNAISDAAARIMAAVGA